MMNKRTLAFSLILAVGLCINDYLLNRFSMEERKTQMVLELIESDKMLSSELYRLFYGLEDDFNFFERKIKTILNKNRSQDSVDSLIEFLSTHPYYFKVRLTDYQGQEIYKMVQRPDRMTYEESKNLYDLSSQNFFTDLNQVKYSEFNFSSMEANVINGKVEKPIRPTIRVSKRIKLSGNQDALLIVNINGQRVLRLFEQQSAHAFRDNKALVDHEGFYVASHPLLEDRNYTLEKAKINQPTLTALKTTSESQGSFEQNGKLVVYTQLPLPQTSEKWFLVSTFSEKTISKSLKTERLTRFFWELLCFLALVFWFWRDEKKRHREQVVQVLLRERSEFIQNVSHQLKTPLAIIFNYLTERNKLPENQEELQKEVTHLIKVVDDLLLLSQVESLKQIPLVDENLLEILNETIELVAVKAKSKRITIRVTVQEELTHRLESLVKPMLPDLLKSAFFNVIDNAIDFSPEQEIIHISLRSVNNKILTTIQDNGPGVSEKLLPVLFEPYTRDLHVDRKGTGLGLSIAKKIIELHKGQISYSTEGRGATFQILL